MGNRQDWRGAERTSDVVAMDLITVQSSSPPSVQAAAAGDAPPKSELSTPSFAKEWEVARDIIAKADERTDSLRRYGFTLVTSLLTLDALGERLAKALGGTAVDSNTSAWVALGIAGVTSLLIVAIRLLENTTELLQSAAAQRAAVIERHLGLELTDIIIDRHNRERWRAYADTLYYVFVASTCITGFVIGGWRDIGTAEFVWRIAGCAALVAAHWCALWMISRVGPRYPRGVADDWSLDRVECKQGESVRIVYARFDKTPWGFRKDDVVWRAKLQHGDASYDYVADDDDLVDDDGGPWCAKAWLWDTTGFPPGLYNIVIDPDGVRIRGRTRAWTLDRRVRVV